ncbi:MAG TPA: NAD(P)-dependent oxidoreductase [Trebonia sp.]
MTSTTEQGAGAITETVAVLGAGGMMGFPITRNIARAGIEVRAWNRSRDKAAPLADDGVHLAGSPAEAVRGAGIVITMLSSAEAVIAVMDGPDGALAAMPRAAADDPRGAPHPIWVQMSTIGEEATTRCAELAGTAGVGFVDAPVLGTKQPAEQGTLVVLESGPEEARPRVRPVFDAIGSKTLRVGEAGAGSLLKLVANSWVVSVTSGTAEAVALAESFGLDPNLFFQAVGGGSLDLPYLQMKGKAMTSRDFSPSFKLALAAKDAGLVVDSAKKRGLDLPMTEAIAQRMKEGAKEYADLDMAATFLTYVDR